MMPINRAVALSFLLVLSGCGDGRTPLSSSSPAPAPSPAPAGSASLLFVRLLDGTVRVFRADAQSGALTVLGDAPVLAAADALVADPRGLFVYRISAGSVSAFRVDATLATLAPSG